MKAVPVADDDVDDDPPGGEDQRSSGFVPPARHVAADRAAAYSLRTAQHITDALSDAGVPEEPVLLNRDGPHRSIDALDRLLAEAISDQERFTAAEGASEGASEGTDEAAARGPDEPED